MQSRMKRRITAVVALAMLVPHVQFVVASEEPEFGTVRLPKDMTIQIHCSIAGTGEPAVLPQGGYNVYHWSIRRTDEEGILWTCEGFVRDDRSVIRVVAGGETELPIGEPIASVLTAVRRGPVVSFSHRLKGRLGETVSIDRDGKRAPAPTLRIRNADGSYEEIFTFEYG